MSERWITVAGRNGPLRLRVYDEDATTGLAVTREEIFEPDGPFVVTHMKSGLRCPWWFEKKADAVKAMARLAKAIDWSRIHGAGDVTIKDAASARKAVGDLGFEA